MKIRAVLFDFGNVLSAPPDPAARMAMEHILGVTETRFHDAYWQFRDAYDRGQLNSGPYWHAVAALLQRPLNDDQLAGLIAADNKHWTQPNQPMIDWATRVQAAGFKVGLLSNIGDAMEAGVLARYPELYRFDHLTLSHRLGIAKPDTAIYLHAATGLGVKPSEVLFIDDREENTLAAMNVGMTAIQYKEQAQFASAIEALSSDTPLPSVVVVTP